MAAIGFYHLTRTGALDALPSLLGRTLAAGQRAMVLCGAEVTVSAVSAALWDSTSPPWLPHGSDAQHTGRPEWQPIWLANTAVSAPNGARYLFLLGGAVPVTHFDRIFDLFDGANPTALAEARRRWSAAQAAGHKLTYWQQGERGWAAQQ